MNVQQKTNVTISVTLLVRGEKKRAPYRLKENTNVPGEYKCFTREEYLSTSNTLDWLKCNLYIAWLLSSAPTIKW